MWNLSWCHGMLITCWVVDAWAWGGSWWLLQWPSLKQDPPDSSLHLSQSFVTWSDLLFVWWVKTADPWHQRTWKRWVFSVVFLAASPDELSRILLVCHGELVGLLLVAAGQLILDPRHQVIISGAADRPLDDFQPPRRV